MVCPQASQSGEKSLMVSYCLRSPQLTKFSEGHVYSHVCLPFCLTVHTSGGLHVTITRNAIGQSWVTWEPILTKQRSPTPGLVHMDLTIQPSPPPPTHTLTTQGSLSPPPPTCSNCSLCSPDCRQVCRCY